MAGVVLAGGCSGALAQTAIWDHFTLLGSVTPEGNVLAVLKVRL
jgi:hypothetical protein